MDVFEKKYSGRVLLVDDSKTNRIVGGKYLEKLGLQVDLAEGCDEAISACEHNRYHIIFMDIYMPDTDGIATAKIIRSRLLSYCPIIALTGHGAEALADDLLQSKMNGVIEKPVTPQKLILELDKYLRKVS
ncbi:MAG: response regulator [Gammaproteobacteria bacterium]|nr:response regulator [Gammaproteobacteria bacterium]MDH5799910.1 response regulator [Gammaproteobacteria bacterium]